MSDKIVDPVASIMEASRNRASFSGHGKAKGAAGFIDPNDQARNVDFLGRRDDTLSISPPAGGFGDIRIAAAWDNRDIPDTSFMGKLLKRTKPANCDIDLGIFYELVDGTRGIIQAFGNQMGSYSSSPYISLSGDERTGNTAGDDEYVHVNGKEWAKFKRILTYVYIYRGPLDWAHIRPQIQIRVPDQNPMVVHLGAQQEGLGLCAIAGIENIRNGLRITNYTEYFPGHAEMDRAFGLGLEWENGEKDPVSVQR